jgi:hypothetical protein
MGKMRVGNLRTRVETRARGRCEYCHAPQAACGYRFHLEHIVPLAEDGSDGFENRALACAACNLAKSDRTSGTDSETKQSVRLFDPRNVAWDEHFQFDLESAHIVGLTPAGRATVESLDLNADFRLDSRELWLAAGLLP